MIAPATDRKRVVEPPVLGGPEHTNYYLPDDLLTYERLAATANGGGPVRVGMLSSASGRAE